MKKQNKNQNKRENFNLTNEEKEILFHFLLDSISSLKNQISFEKFELEEPGWIFLQDEIRESIQEKVKLKSVLSKFLSGQIKNY